MLRWAACRPHEVPTVNGEWFFITALSADAEDSPRDAPAFWDGEYTRAPQLPETSRPPATTTKTSAARR